MKANSDQISLPIVSKGTTNKPNSYRTKPNYSTNNRKEKLNSIKENKSIAPVSKSAGRVTPFVDAETGEPLKFSLARWNTREGRVNLDGRTIIEMGTGRLDISRRVQANPSTSSIASYNSSTISCIDSPNKSPDNCNYVSFATDSITINSPESVGNRIHNHSISCGTYAQSDSGTVQTRHPLLTQYLKTGPINIKHNKYWNPRTNTVIVPKSEQDFDDEIDGAVSNGNDGDKRTAGSQNDSWNDSYSTFSVNESLDSYPFSNSAIDDLKYLDDTNRRESSSPLIEHNNSIRDSVVSTPSKISSLRPVFRELITLNPKIAADNQRNWRAIEEKAFQELYTHAAKYETNKFLTKEKPVNGGLATLKRTCRDLSKLKVKALRELAQAVGDEAVKEQERQKQEIECKSILKLVELKNLNDEQREKARLYLEALQRDNEIIFIRKLGDSGLLW